MAYIKEVGNAVHKETVQKYDASLKERPDAQTVDGGKQKVHTGNPTQAPTAKGRKVPVAGVIAAVAVLVLIVILLVKLLGR